MKIKNTRLGNLEIDKDKVIHFPKGIPGFEKLRQFILLPVEGTKQMQWLQALEDHAIALLVIDPFIYFKGYEINIPQNDVEKLEIKDHSETLVLTTITIPRDNPAGTTANLVAPIVINTRLKKAKQLILTGTPYFTKHRLFPEKNVKPNKKVSGGEGA